MDVLHRKKLTHNNQKIMSQEQKSVNVGTGKRVRRSYKSEEITTIVCEYLRSGMGIVAFSRQAGIPNQTLSQWVARFKECHPTIVDKAMSKDQKTRALENEVAQLKRELAEANKQLEFERYKAHAYDTMIDVAEQMLNIPIRKKAGTKQ